MQENVGASDPKLQLVDLHLVRPLHPSVHKRVRQGGGAGEAARGFQEHGQGPGPGPSPQHCPLQGLLLLPVLALMACVNTVSRWREGFPPQQGGPHACQLAAQAQRITWPWAPPGVWLPWEGEWSPHVSQANNSYGTVLPGPLGEVGVRVRRLGPADLHLHLQTPPPEIP